MAATDAHPVPIRAAAYRVTFPILDADGDLVTGAAALDSEFSEDGAAFGDCTNEATEIATASGLYYLDLVNTEMDGDTVAVIIKTSTSGAKTTPIVMYPQGATNPINVNVQTISDDATAADNLELMYDGTGYAGGTTKLGVDVVAISGDATAADNAELMFDGTGYAGGTIKLGVDTVAISGDSVAADNLEAAADGTGYNLGGGSVVAASVTGAVGGAVGSVTGNVGGNVTGSVGSLAAQAKADVNAEVVDALATDTYAEVAGVVAATSSLKDKINWMFALSRNKLTQTANTQTLRNDADGASIATAAVSDDGTTATRDEWA